MLAATNVRVRVLQKKQNVYVLSKLYIQYNFKHAVHEIGSPSSWSYIFSQLYNKPEQRKTQQRQNENDLSAWSVTVLILLLRMRYSVRMRDLGLDLNCY